ncbi:TMF-regulated nuclear protein 1 [Athene noctua]|uniref:TMF-regulated nuclear protein 1 n=1 Tax=Athene noctua TaxID=126797 RepID=UPI003EB741FC
MTGVPGHTVPGVPGPCCTKPGAVRTKLGAGARTGAVLYQARGRAGAVPSHTKPGAVRAIPSPSIPRRGAPGWAGVASPPLRSAPCTGAEPVPEPPPAGPSRTEPAPPLGYISSPRRCPAPVPVPMAAATAADPGPVAGGEQRADRDGTNTGTTTTTGSGGGGGSSSSSGGGGNSSSPGSVELAAARRRLVAAEGRRRAAAELEGRVRQVHCALRHAELRLAARAEALGRLGAGVAQAQLALAAQSQRLQKGLRRRPRPRPAALLAAARALRSCVPWAPARSRGAAAPATATRRLPAAPRSPA